MSDNEYTPPQALELLMRKIRSRDEMLADRIQEAIDEGKDVLETEISSDRRQKRRAYRKTVPFTHEEALDVALRSLEAHFIEIPLFINSALADFKESALGIPEQRRTVLLIGKEEPEIVVEHARGEAKDLDVELQPETRLSGDDRPPLRMRPVALDQIAQQRENLQRLVEMAHFDEEPHDGDNE